MLAAAGHGPWLSAALGPCGAGGPNASACGIPLLLRANVKETRSEVRNSCFQLLHALMWKWRLLSLRGKVSHKMKP